MYSLSQLEDLYIREVLRLTRGNRTEAARILGINRKTLLEKRKRYRIS
jgi:DNA-binding protein Fis